MTEIITDNSSYAKETYYTDKVELSQGIFNGREVFNISDLDSTASKVFTFAKNFF